MAGARGGGKNAFPTNGGTGGASRPQCVSSHPGEQTVTGRDRELPVSTRGPRTQGRGLEWQGKVHKKPGRKAKTAGSREVHFPAQQRRDDEDVGGDSGQSGSAGRPEALLMPRRKTGWYVIVYILLILSLYASSKNMGGLSNLPFLFGLIHSKACDPGRLQG